MDRDINTLDGFALREIAARRFKVIKYTDECLILERSVPSALSDAVCIPNQKFTQRVAIMSKGYDNSSTYGKIFSANFHPHTMSVSLDSTGLSLLDFDAIVRLAGGLTFTSCAVIDPYKKMIF